MVIPTPNQTWHSIKSKPVHSGDFGGCIFFKPSDIISGTSFGMFNATICQRKTSRSQRSEFTHPVIFVCVFQGWKKKNEKKHVSYVDVSLNGGTPKSSILIGFSIIFTIHFGVFPYFWKHPCFIHPKRSLLQ